MSKSVHQPIESSQLQQLASILHALNLDLSVPTQTKILAYLDLLQRWNRVYNLTAITDPNDMLIKHIADSLVIWPYITGKQCIDVGTGAGLPGIPLALMFPDKHWTLLDSNGKKTRFLLQVKAQLGLNNVTIVQARAEEFFPGQCFENVITRAWTNLSDMIAKTKQLYCPGGCLLAMKGAYPTEELQGLNLQVVVYPLQVPNLAEQRHLVCVTF